MQSPEKFTFSLALGGGIGVTLDRIFGIFPVALIIGVALGLLMYLLSIRPDEGGEDETETDSEGPDRTGRE